MTDGHTVSRWGPEPPPVEPLIAVMWERLADALAKAPTCIESVTTAPAGPLKAPDLTEIRRIAEQARALRPEGDRLVMAPGMVDVVRRISTPAPTYAGTFGGLPFGIPIHVDPGMPDGVIEFRDGDRVLKAIQYTPKTTIEVYPVGLLADLLRDWRQIRHWRELRAAGGKPILHVRHAVRYLALRLRERNWRSVKSALNGYLAEPTPFPEEIRRCGSGWTRKRALRSLRRQYERAGLTMPDPS